MSDNLGRLSDIVLRKLAKVPGRPNRSVLRALLETAYLATLRTEEGRFIRGSLTFANPVNPDSDPPPLRRIDYPRFTPFQRRVGLGVGALVKLSRAIDGWSSSIAVFGTSASNIFSWGVVDQLVHRSVRLHHEGHSGVPGPGVLSIHMDGVGALSVYHGDLLLGGVRQERLVHREVPALSSRALFARLAPVLIPIGERIAATLGQPDQQSFYVQHLFHTWSVTVARICIGLRRLQTGGLLLFTDSPLPRIVDIPNHFNYDRLSRATLLSVLDQGYYHAVSRQSFAAREAMTRDLLVEEGCAEADHDDRQLELAGAVRLATSLAAVDGAVVLTPTLGIRAFGAKVIAAGAAKTVYDGPQFATRRTRAKHVETSRFGTRHAAAFRFCRADPTGFGIVVSQDGVVRLVLRSGLSLMMWDDVRLVGYDANARAYLRRESRRRERREGLRFRDRRGYTKMPKSLDELMSPRRTP